MTRFEKYLKYGGKTIITTNSNTDTLLLKKMFKLSYSEKNKLKRKKKYYGAYELFLKSKRQEVILTDLQKQVISNSFSNTIKLPNDLQTNNN